MSFSAFKKTAILNLSKFLQKYNLEEVQQLPLTDVLRFRINGLLVTETTHLHWQAEEKLELRQMLHAYHQMLQIETKNVEQLLQKMQDSKETNSVH